MKKSPQEKMFIKLEKELNLLTDDQLLYINDSLNRLYKFLNKKRSVEDFIKAFLKKKDSEEFIIFSKYSMIIDNYMGSFTDYYLQRNITFIQSGIQEVLDNRHRIIIKRQRYGGI